MIGLWHSDQAAGSSLLAKLCNILVQDALGLAGMLDIGAVTVLPVATGMALTLTLLAMKAQRPTTARWDPRSTPVVLWWTASARICASVMRCLRMPAKGITRQTPCTCACDDLSIQSLIKAESPLRDERQVCTHRYVLWPRIDQKTCLKAIVSANLEVVPLESMLVGDELHTDMAAMRRSVVRLGPENIVCIVTTSSCFAPRAADSLVEVAKLCKLSGIGHIINNAYGVQSAALCSLVCILQPPASLAATLLLSIAQSTGSTSSGVHSLGTRCCQRGPF